jgi:hypothetical protein
MPRKITKKPTRKPIKKPVKKTTVKTTQNTVVNVTVGGTKRHTGGVKRGVVPVKPISIYNSLPPIPQYSMYTQPPMALEHTPKYNEYYRNLKIELEDQATKRLEENNKEMNLKMQRLEQQQSKIDSMFMSGALPQYDTSSEYQTPVKGQPEESKGIEEGIPMADAVYLTSAEMNTLTPAQKKQKVQLTTKYIGWFDQAGLTEQGPNDPKMRITNLKKVRRYMKKSYNVILPKGTGEAWAEMMKYLESQNISS